MYVPAYFYIQSKTLGDDHYELSEGRVGESILISHWYQSHSALVDMVFDGIDDNGWTDRDKNKYDNMLETYVGDIL